MVYTVKKLAKHSGVSIRTLRFYDEINLLKPAYYGGNNYRYYEEEQLLMLQQILFYRELGFSLNDIQGIINGDDFNKVNALISHRHDLEQGLDRTKKLIETIDKTIEHLRGKIKMESEEFYYGFDSEIQRSHEKNLVKKGIVTQEFIDECNVRVNNWSNKEKNEFIQDIERIINEIIDAINHNKLPSDKKVQDLMKEHYEWLRRSWNPTKEKYLGLIELYKTPEFRQFYDSRHPKLLDFFVDAMKVYSEKSL